MARPLRIEYPRAIYHITSRGNAKERIFLEDADRRIFWDVFGAVVEKQNFARKGYRKFVVASVELMDESPWKELVDQIIFGSADFISDIQSRICDIKKSARSPVPRGLPGDLP